MKNRLADFLSGHESLQGCGLPRQTFERLGYAIEQQFLSDYLGMMVTAIEDIMGIRPDLEWKDILEAGAEKIVSTLSADAASIRLFDPEAGDMVAFGSHRFAEKDREPTIPFDDSIAGQVARTGRSRTVPSILDEPGYLDKSVVTRRGLNSLIVVPIHIPRFLREEAEIHGALQIYYAERNRRFEPLEIAHAEVLARRISYVVARKRLNDLAQLNQQKERLLETIFLKLSNREGIKMKDLFRVMIPELEDIIEIRICSLFAVSPDRKGAWLEVTHPPDGGVGEESLMFRPEDHPYMKPLLEEGPEGADSETERIDPAYVLIKDPARSPLAGPALARFMGKRRLNSMLAVPLRARGKTAYFITFFTSDRKTEFSPRDIELLTFFAKEVMQALRIERLDDILHDIKNPAVALGGFARRARRLLEKEGAEAARERIFQALDIVIEEAERLESMATSRTIEGRERVVEIGRLLKARYRLNEEALRQRGKRNVRVSPCDAEEGLKIYCVPFDLERVLDNLLMNAAEAVEEGGTISAACSREGGRVCLEVRNSGAVDGELLEAINDGRATGRGLHIVSRFVQSTGGSMRVLSENGEVVFRLDLPLRDA